MPETLAAFDWPSYSTSVLPGSVDTRHVDELFDDMQSIPVVHLVAEATGLDGNGPKSAPCFNAAGLRTTKWVVCRLFGSTPSRIRTGVLLRERQAS